MEAPVFECNVTVKDTEYRFRVFCDESPENPRDWDNLGTIVTFRSHWTRNNGYPCGDQQEYPFDFAEEIKNGDRVPALWFPLWASSCGLSLGEQNEKDDSIVGYIFAERTLLLKEYSAKILSKEVKEKVKQVFKGELETYNLYFNGEVYGYILETVSHCKHCGKTDYETVDSCWGYYGSIKESGILDNFDTELKQAIQAEL